MYLPRVFEGLYDIDDDDDDGDSTLYILGQIKNYAYYKNLGAQLHSWHSLFPALGLGHGSGRVGNGIHSIDNTYLG